MLQSIPTVNKYILAANLKKGSSLKSDFMDRHVYNIL